MVSANSSEYRCGDKLCCISSLSMYLSVLLFKLQCVVCLGMALLRCGEVQKQLSDAERKFVQSTNIHFLTPLRNFTEGEHRTIQVNHTSASTPIVCIAFIQNILYISSHVCFCCVFVGRMSAGCC